jgi:hypothetical protein
MTKYVDWADVAAFGVVAKFYSTSVKYIINATYSPSIRRDLYLAAASIRYGALPDPRTVTIVLGPKDFDRALQNLLDGNYKSLVGPLCGDSEKVRE